MARPSRTNIETANESWQAALQDNLKAVFDTPYPVPQYANLGAFPSAASYDLCLVVAIDTGKLYLSRGSVWKEVTVAA